MCVCSALLLLLLLLLLTGKRGLGARTRPPTNCLPGFARARFAAGQARVWPAGAPLHTATPHACLLNPQQKHVFGERARPVSLCASPWIFHCTCFNHFWHSLVRASSSMSQQGNDA